jgi:hypothetical protein
MLNLTLDNASNNDTLVETLAEKVDAFAGKAAQVRCFNHVINLTAHTIVKQFDVPKAKADKALAAAERALVELAAGVDIEEDLFAGHLDQDDTELGEDNAELTNELNDEYDLGADEEVWEEERGKLTDAERDELDNSVRPVRLVLAKVSADPIPSFRISAHQKSRFERHLSPSSTPLRSSFPSGRPR